MAEAGEAVPRTVIIVRMQRPARPARTAPLFSEEDTTLPPTWVEGADVYHTVAQCSRLREIRRNRRVTGKPGVQMRLCWNCEDILRAKRSG